MHPVLQVVALLEAAGCFTQAQLVQAHEATHEMLLDVHEESYLKAINSSPTKVAWVCSALPCCAMPCCAMLRWMCMMRDF